MLTNVATQCVKVEISTRTQIHKSPSLKTPDAMRCLNDDGVQQHSFLVDKLCATADSNMFRVVSSILKGECTVTSGEGAFRTIPSIKAAGSSGK